MRFCGTDPFDGELVGGVLHQGSKLILGGSSKSYKTWSLIDLAISVSTGTPWLGFPTAAGKVLYVNLEIQTGFFRHRLGDVTEAKDIELNTNLEVWNLRGHAADFRSLVPRIRDRIQGEEHALVILDPTYKLLGTADENNATDMSALLNTVENLTVSSGAAVALAGHFAKGNPSAKETIDRISGSGVFARDPDSLVIFTKHEEEGAFAVEMVLRNFPPVDPFVVQWQHPLFRRADGLDPAKLKSIGGRPAQHSPDDLLECLGVERMSLKEWQQIAREEFGISESRFYFLKKILTDQKRVAKSHVDGKWHRLEDNSRNLNRANPQ